MKMLWKLTDNIKYEDCEVSAALVVLAAAGSELYLPAPPPLLTASCEMRVGQTFPIAVPASPIRPKNAREKLERKDVDAVFFHFPPSNLVSHFPPFFFWPVLGLAKSGAKRRAWVFEAVVGNWARVCAPCVSLQRDSGGPRHQEEKGKRKPISLLPLRSLIFLLLFIHFFLPSYFPPPSF